jgi:hypothetical protein
LIAPFQPPHHSSVARIPSFAAGGRLAVDRARAAFAIASDPGIADMMRVSFERADSEVGDRASR